jgi:hypothetical protein
MDETAWAAAVPAAPIALAAAACLLAQGPVADPISGGAGWVGAGLLGMVLMWILLWMIPQMMKAHKETVAGLMADLKETRLGYEKTLQDTRLGYEKALQSVLTRDEQRSVANEKSLQAVLASNEQRSREFAQALKADLEAIARRLEGRRDAAH